MSAAGRSGLSAGLYPMPLDTLDYWIEAYQNPCSADFFGHGMLVRAAQEYRAMREVAKRVITAWDSTVLPRSNDGMMQERMEELRAFLEAQHA